MARRTRLKIGRMVASGTSLCFISDFSRSKYSVLWSRGKELRVLARVLATSSIVNTGVMDLRILVSMVYDGC